MKIKIIECKGESISVYKECLECDSFSIQNRHIGIFKGGTQILHLPARYFGVEVLPEDLVV